MIRFCDDALQKARLLAESSETTVRIGTSLLYKCRELAELWPRVNEIRPELRIEIRPMKEYENRTTVFSRLGIDFDLFEGVYASAWEGSCQFLELQRTPLCVGVSASHRLAHAQELSMEDLNSEVLVMPVEGVSDEMDAFRNMIRQNLPSVKIMDSTYYGVDTFALCEMNSYILITQPVYADIHPNLITIPLQTDIAMPYGLIYATDAPAAADKFIQAIRQLNANK